MSNTALYDAIHSAVTRAETVMASAAALIAGFAAAARVNANNPTAILDLCAELDSKTADLSNAVVANTVVQGTESDQTGNAGAETNTSGASDVGTAGNGSIDDSNAGSTVDTGAGTESSSIDSGNDSVQGSTGNDSPTESENASSDTLTGEDTPAASEASE